MVTVTRTLSYAQANSLVATLKRFLTSRGDIYRRYPFEHPDYSGHSVFDPED